MIEKVCEHYSGFLVISLGLLLTLLGVTTMIHPQIMGRYGLVTADAHAKSTIMAIIGGAEIGLGLFVLFGQKLGATISARTCLLLFLFAGLLSGRFLGVILHYPELPSVFFREAVLELIIASMLSIGVYLNRRNKHQGNY